MSKVTCSLGHEHDACDRCGVTFDDPPRDGSRGPLRFRWVITYLDGTYWLCDTCYTEYKIVLDEWVRSPRPADGATVCPVHGTEKSASANV